LADSFYPGRMNSRTSTGKKELSVSELNTLAKAVLENEPLLSGLTVSGEISNFKRNASGHCYFTLKDAQAAVSCVMFRSAAERLTFSPNNGMKVSVKGHISLYTVSGSYQLYAETMEDKNSAGDLFAEYRQLWEKLSAEGLFDSSRKMRIPVYPSRIAVITSGTGAAVMDILRILRRRWPLCKVLLLPVSVQGAEAAPQIAGALKYATRWKIADVIICGRGGGSLEDLWCFNDERVAKAIFDCDTPVISAVGHEVDFTIADFVSDLRAPTPSAAAELAIFESNAYLEQLARYESNLFRLMNQKVTTLSQQFKQQSLRLQMNHPKARLEKQMEQTQKLQERLFQLMGDRVMQTENRLKLLAEKLNGHSPLRKLQGGYGYLERQNQPLASVKQLQKEDTITITIHDGRIESRVMNIETKGEENE